MKMHVFATKNKMTQAWTTAGKRVAVTCLRVTNNLIVGKNIPESQEFAQLEIGYGKKKLKNMSKPLRSKLEKGGFSSGVRHLKMVNTAADTTLNTGDTIKIEDILQVGDVVQVQGTTKGRGFAGAMKRYGFSGGPKTHGQSDRWRAVGSIGNRSIPGRVFRGKRMPGHYGVDLQTVKGLVVLYVNPLIQEVWLSGPVPGHINALVTIAKTGLTRKIDLDEKASGIVAPEVVAAPVVEETKTEVTPEVVANEGGAQ